MCLCEVSMALVPLSLIPIQCRKVTYKLLLCKAIRWPARTFLTSRKVRLNLLTSTGLEDTALFLFISNLVLYQLHVPLLSPSTAFFSVFPRGLRHVNYLFSFFPYATIAQSAYSSPPTSQSWFHHTYEKRPVRKSPSALGSTA